MSPHVGKSRIRLGKLVLNPSYSHTTTIPRYHGCNSARIPLTAHAGSHPRDVRRRQRPSTYRLHERPERGMRSRSCHRRYISMCQRECFSALRGWGMAYESRHRLWWGYDTRGILIYSKKVSSMQAHACFCI